ncbi:sigma-54-dependent Fis family transcriptional regulator [Candidatus Formimonas warabiya]|uniref:Sigma-54-dependent Fis family transcriptional regulator n=1 Tax=Formimonas warabiya TaxID=1761012 RepID=A0A3G1L0S2_FORW1|nr:sigma-54-dependent Fis family transcriptional regulator [Candidatus Formimonas warabiya]
MLRTLLKQENDYSGEVLDVTEYKYILETIVNNPYEGIMVVNEKGFIIMMNQAYGEFLGRDPQKTIGKFVGDVIENTRMQIVLETGKAELLQVQRINNHDIVCNRVPIRKGNKLIGAFCQVLFRDVVEFKNLAKNMDQLKLELQYYKSEFDKRQGTKYTIDSIVGMNAKIIRLKELLLKAGRTNSTVLIQGESGTGKELFAHALHNASYRRMGPFIKVNCAALPETLLESELFGYDTGAFTGAKKGGSMGKFELAQGGTIFLDEIGDMPLGMQAKILRVLQEREIERLGSGNSIPVDVRIIAATNQNLEELVKKGEFRQDLFYRLNVVPLNIVPLRERREDIPLLVEYLLLKLANKPGFSKKQISPEALDILVNGHCWPGNVRELENILERALNFMGESSLLKPVHLPLEIFSKNMNRKHDFTQFVSLKNSLEEIEHMQLEKALIATEGNTIKAAKLLDISKSTLYEKIKKYGIILKDDLSKIG